MFPWKSIFKINKNAGRPVFLQIVDTLTSEVSSGRIQKGDQLPGTRELAKLLGLNRKTVLSAYDELIAQGWIEVVPSKGTFIKKDFPLIRPLAILENQVAPTEPPIRNPGSFQKMINDGTPDYRLSPIDLLYKHARSVSKGIIGKNTLLGDHRFGENHLRSTLSNYLRNTRGISCTIDQVMVTRGSQMSIYLAFSVLLKKNDAVIVGELNYRSANETIVAVGGRLIKVGIGSEGLNINEIEDVVKKQKIRALYVTPHHHYPTTVTLPVAHRLKLLELASKYDFYIIEDDYDYDYHYNRSPILPMASIDREGRVIYIGSFSKLLAPSIRIGYMHGSVKFIEECAQRRILIDRRGDPVIERALSILIEENEIARSLKKTIAIYKSRRDIMCQYLMEGLGSSGISFVKPEGGMAVWVTFNSIKIKDLIYETARSGLHLDVDLYHLESSCRLGFASMDEKEMADHCEILISSILKMRK